MRKTFILTATLLLFAVASTVFAAPTASKTFSPTDKVEGKKTFEQLKNNTKKGLLVPNAVAGSKFVAIDPVDMKFPPLDDLLGPDSTVTDPGTPAVSGVVPGITNGMRIWFELPDGRLADPRAYRFSPNEVFFMHVEAAVPVYVALYQNFPDKQETAQAYPVERFPTSYRILEAGKGTKLPVMFKMDDNFDIEHMSIVVARADWEEITKDVPDSATTAVALAKATTPNEYAAVYRGIAKGKADISSPKVLTKFAAFAEIEWGSGDTSEDDAPKTDDEPKKDDAPQTDDEPKKDDAPQTDDEPKKDDAPKTDDEPKKDDAPKTDDKPTWDGTSNEVDEVAIYLFSQVGVGHLQVELQKVDNAQETVVVEEKQETVVVEPTVEEKVEVKVEEKVEEKTEAPKETEDEEMIDISKLQPMEG